MAKKKDADAKKPEEKKDGKDHLYQLFGLSIVKQIDQKTRQVHLEIKSKSEGMPIAEAILLVEGWLVAEKEKLIGPVFHPKKEAGQ